MLKHLSFILTLVFCFALSPGCSKKQATEIKPDSSPAPESPGAGITYGNFAQALFQSKCSGCHAQGGQGSAAFNFTGYSAITANADRIKQAVLVNKSMPLGGSLSATELQSLKTWFDQGMPQ